MSEKVRVDPKRWQGIYKRELEGGDVAYYITFKDGEGRKRWERIGTKGEGYTPQIAEEMLAKRKREIRHGEDVKTVKEAKAERAQKNRIFDQIAKHYFEAKGASLKGAVTDINRYEVHLKPVVGGMTVKSVTVLTIAKIKKNMTDKAPGTVWNVLELLRRLANYGYKVGIAPKLNFVIDMPVLDNEQVEYMTPEELGRFLDVLKDWRRKDVVRMLRLAMFTGCRRGEIFRLEDRDLDFHQGLIALRNPKGKKTVSVPMSNLVKEILQEQIAWRNETYPGSPYVFPGVGGGLRTDCSAVERIKEAAGLPDTWRPFHGLRHHFAVTLANSGQVDLALIQDMLTHKSAAMTRRYAKFLPQTKQAAAELAANLLQPREPAKVIPFEKKAVGE